MGNSLTNFFGLEGVSKRNSRLDNLQAEYSAKNLSSTIFPRKSAELILSDGTRRYFRCRSSNKRAALKEVLNFVVSVEEATNDKVMWRFRGDDTYYMGTKIPTKTTLSFKDQGKKILNYFFDLD